MASGPKPSSARSCSACRGLATVPNRPGQRSPLPTWPAAGRGPRPRAGWPNLGKMYTASFTSPQCTPLTWLRAPAHSDEGGRRRGGTDRCGRLCQNSTAVKVPVLWVGEQLWALVKLWACIRGERWGEVAWH
jgi:hypothetical protein